MPLIYSLDLRKRALQLVDEENMSYTEISNILGINRRTLSNWRQLREKTGTVEQPKIIFKGGYRPVVTDWATFRVFAEKNADKTTKEMAKLWGSGSPSTIARSLRKIDFTRKKKLLGTKNAARKTEKNI